jgi:hypothetical protein
MKTPRLTLFGAFFFLLSGLLAQPELGPAINDGILPGDDADICDIPLALDILITDGPGEGELVEDFTLFDLDGSAYHLQDIMSDGKPVLLISASYSCFVFRGKVDLINTLHNEYGDDMHIFVIYTVEAHPYGDISPYYGFENTGEQNFDAGVLVPQAETYGERKATAEEMIAELGLEATVLLDGPCNEWWINYGSSPNNAYLIQNDGLVYDAQIWLDRYPEDIYSSVAGIFGETLEGEPTPTGEFSVVSYSDTCVVGDPGSTVITYAYLENLDTVASYLDLYKISEDMPGSWSTSICTDVCYPPTTDLVNMYIEAGTSPSFSFYFYTTLGGSEGEVNLLVKNAFVPANSYNLLFKACTSLSTTDIEVTTEQHSFYMYPNPATEQVNLFLADYPDSLVQIEVLDIQGRMIHKMEQVATNNAADLTLPLTGLPGGYYFVQVTGRTKTDIQPLVVR